MAKDSAYDSYEGFLRAAIKGYWETKGASKATFIALLLATREAWAVAWGKTTSAEAGKKMLTGAAGAAAVAVLLRTFVGGPIGLLLTGASVASLVAVYVRNHERIWERVEIIRRMVDAYRGQYETVHRDRSNGTLTDDQRDLMIDGLMGRFLLDLDRDPAEDGGPAEHRDPAGSSPRRGTFSEHVHQRRQDDDEPSA